MKTINRIKALLAPILSAITDNVYDGSIGYFSRRFYGGSNGAWNEIPFSEDITLDYVTDKDNYTFKPIVIARDTQGGVTTDVSTLGFNTSTYSTYFGNFRNASTGTFNVSMGYNSLASLTSGEYNTALGTYALATLTTGFRNTAIGMQSGKVLSTGNFNTFIGMQAGFNATTGDSNTYIGSEAGLYNIEGYKNTYIGVSTGYLSTTGNLNTIIGYKAALSSTTIGDRNIIIGASSANLLTGSNNIIIGNGGGALETDINNKLIIHNNETFTGYSNTDDGVFTTPQKSNLSNALITGDFSEKWVKINGKFHIPTGYLTTSIINSVYNNLITYDPTTGLLGKRTIDSLLNKQNNITVDTAMSSDYNLSTLFIGATCTVTIPSTITTPFRITGYVRLGFELTIAVGTGVTLVGNDSVVNVPPDSTFVLEKIGATNEYLLKIGG